MSDLPAGASTVTAKIVESNNKTVLITGADSGIGRVVATELALRGYHVFIAGLEHGQAPEVLAEIEQLSAGTARAEFLPLDLGDLESVERCANMFLQRNIPLHCLINNAGVVGARGLTASGFEMTFGVCYIGHFLLTQLLTDCLIASGPSRIINVASKLHGEARSFNFDEMRRPNTKWIALKHYRIAKLAMVLHAIELARRLEGTGVKTYSLHPGTVPTNIWKNVPKVIVRFIQPKMLTAEEGAVSSLHCATADLDAIPSGSYFDKRCMKEVKGLAKDPILAKKLWEQTEQWLQESSQKFQEREYCSEPAAI